VTYYTAVVFVAAVLFSASATAAEAPSEADHPTLFFDAGDIDKLRSACQGPMRGQFEAIREYADEHLTDEPPVLKGDYERRGLAVEHPYLTNILDFSFLYMVTGEGKYLDAARRWALALAAMPKWAGPVNDECPEADRGLYAGFGLTALACAYDWLHGDLSEIERALIRNKLYTVAERIHRATYGGEWWSKAYLHHDHTIPVGGMGLAAMALYDEFGEARRWAARAESEFACTLERLGTDGAWPEGTCGWAFAMASFCPFWDAYSRRAAPQWGGNEWLRNTWAFRLYSRVPDGRFFNFGDGRADGHYQWTGWQAAPTLRLLAGKFEDPHAQWLAAREWETRPNPYTAVWEIIWADPSVPEAAPDDLDLVKTFDNQGLCFMRTGWGADEIAAAFRCDSLVGLTAAGFYEEGDDAMRTAVNHTHADAGSLVLWANGTFPLTNAGYGQRTTEHQNTLLVDGAGQYRDLDRKRHPGRPRGSLTRRFTSPFVSLVEGDATLCYDGGVEKFTRTVYLVRTGLVFLLDEVRCRRPSRLEWRFHTDKKARVEFGAGGFSSSAGDVICSVLPATSGPLETGVEEDRWNRRVRVATAEDVEGAPLLCAIVPVTAPAASFAVESADDVGFVIRLEDIEILAARGGAAGDDEPQSNRRLKHDGRFALASRNTRSVGFFADEARSVRLDDVDLLRAERAVTASLIAQGDLAFLDVVSERRARVAVNPFAAVRSVRCEDGGEVAIESDGGLVAFHVPAGASRYLLALESSKTD
jgi:hypothetical protein